MSIRSRSVVQHLLGLTGLALASGAGTACGGGSGSDGDGTVDAAAPTTIDASPVSIDAAPIDAGPSPPSGTIYGQTSDNWMCAIDLAAQTVTPVVPLHWADPDQRYVQSAEIAPDGTIWAVTIRAGNTFPTLVTCSRATGACEPVRALDFEGAVEFINAEEAYFLRYYGHQPLYHFDVDGGVGGLIGPTDGTTGAVVADLESIPGVGVFTVVQHFGQASDEVVRVDLATGLVSVIPTSIDLGVENYATASNDGSLILLRADGQITRVDPVTGEAELLFVGKCTGHGSWYTGTVTP